MTGLRYVGASRALGLQQEVPPSPDESGPSSLHLWEHISRIINWKAASSKHLPRTDFSGKGRRPSGPRIHVPAPCRNLAAGIEQGLQLPQPC